MRKQVTSANATFTDGSLCMPTRHDSSGKNARNEACLTILRILQKNLDNFFSIVFHTCVGFYFVENKLIFYKNTIARIFLRIIYVVW